MTHRPDIDGLRAVAVLSVIAFHFSGSTLNGGFLGVDIFFVISGYLITRIIRSDIELGRFTILGFYERRLRRIAPALLLVLIPCTVVALVMLLPADLIGYAKSLLATLASGANIYFWLDTNYFARLAEQKPLLHMWSLGVEEQYYLLFPLLLWMLARRARSYSTAVVLAITAFSFFLDAFANKVGAANPAFYLLPTRAWELGVGASLALLSRPDEGGSPRFPLWTLVTALLGAAMVVAALVQPRLLPKIFPVATLAVAGTGLLIRLGEHGGSVVNRLLAVRPVAGIGLISYSLYLWHWPVIVFSKYYLVRGLRPFEIALATLFMFGAAYLSWRYVEQRYRRREYPVRRLVWLTASVASILALVAVAVILAHGLPQRLSRSAAKINEAVGTYYRCTIADSIPFGANRGCGLNLPTGSPADAEFVLLGNSHAQMYAPVWESIIESRGVHGMLVPLNACLPTVEANVSPECARMARQNLEEILALPKVRTVVVAQTWRYAPDDIVDSRGQPLDNTSNRALVSGLDDLIARLRARGLNVVLVGPVAEPGWDVASELSRLRAFGHPVDRPLEVSTAEFLEIYSPAIKHFEGRQDVAFARPDAVQCQQGTCAFLMDGESLFSDDNHLSEKAVQRFKGIFSAALDKAVAE